MDTWSTIAAWTGVLLSLVSLWWQHRDKYPSLTVDAVVGFRRKGITRIKPDYKTVVAEVRNTGRSAVHLALKARLEYRPNWFGRKTYTEGIWEAYFGQDEKQDYTVQAGAAFQLNFIGALAEFAKQLRERDVSGSVPVRALVFLQTGQVFASRRFRLDVNDDPTFIQPNPEATLDHLVTD